MAVFKLQTKAYTCGPTSLRAALQLLGHAAPPHELYLARLCGTDSSGTNEYEIARGALELGYRARVFNETSGKRAWRCSLREICNGRAVIACVDRWSHWVVPLQECPGGVLVFDPAKGTTLMNRRHWLKRWKHRRLYSGVVVWR